MKKFVLGVFVGIILSVVIVYELQEWQTRQVMNEIEVYSNGKWGRE